MIPLIVPGGKVVVPKPVERDLAGKIYSHARIVKNFIHNIKIGLAEAKIIQNEEIKNKNLKQEYVSWLKNEFKETHRLWDISTKLQNFVDDLVSVEKRFLSEKLTMKEYKEKIRKMIVEDKRISEGFIAEANRLEAVFEKETFIEKSEGINRFPVLEHILRKKHQVEYNVAISAARVANELKEIKNLLLLEEKQR